MRVTDVLHRAPNASVASRQSTPHPSTGILTTPRGTAYLGAIQLNSPAVDFTTRRDPLPAVFDSSDEDFELSEQVM